jgi:prepilin-type N-terminal cleavage/methylation domain-containing protein
LRLAIEGSSMFDEARSIEMRGRVVRAGCSRLSSRNRVRGARDYPPAQSTSVLKENSMQTMNIAPSRRASGFTLVELAVVIVIIGVLAAFGVPRFIKSVEKSKATEAFEYLASVRTSQERYLAQNGTYANAVSLLDIVAQSPKYFDTPTTITVSGAGVSPAVWSLTLTRVGSAAGYDGYTVTFTQDGFDTANSTIATGTANTDINPLYVTTTSGS